MGHVNSHVLVMTLDILLALIQCILKLYAPLSPSALKGINLKISVLVDVATLFVTVVTVSVV